jgi:hypothetical protein
VRFTDFLRTSVILFGASATALAVSTLAGANAGSDIGLLYLAVAWWALAAAVGLWLGRRNAPSPGIARMMAGARPTPTMPELEPGTLLFNRLWPLAAFTVVAGGLAFLLPSVPAVGTGYALIIALAWRRQSAAVQAVEERDGVQFHVEHISPFRPTQLLRTPGLRRFTEGLESEH